MRSFKYFLFSVFLIFSIQTIYSQKTNTIIDYTHGYLLGGIDGKKYILPSEAQDKIKINAEYRLYSLSGYLGKGKVENIVTEQPPCHDVYFIGLKTDFTPNEKENIIALSGEQDALPKTLKNENTKQKTYIDLLTEYLKKSGVKNLVVKINQIIRTDLDADGVEEVIISANSHFDSFHDKIQGDYYSIILLRKLINGKVENIPITIETKMTDLAYVNKVTGILDINNDGKMEIITSSAYYEGQSTIIYKIDKNNPEVILSAGCGA